MRASIITWRTGMSTCAIKAATRCNLASVSVTKTWLLRGSAMALPRADNMRGAAPVLSPGGSNWVTMSVALAYCKRNPCVRRGSTASKASAACKRKVSRETISSGVPIHTVLPCQRHAKP